MVAFLRTALEYVGFPGGSESKESTCNAGNLDSILGLERFLEKERAPTPVSLGFPGGSAGKEAPYSGLENSI